MEENFDLLAQSRANYFTKGSPVQFVKVELLKGDVSGDIAVCLSFKNISAAPLAQLQITFKCKDRSGAVVCQDQFLYEGLNAAHGEVFGADDAVYISSSPASPTVAPWISPVIPACAWRRPKSCLRSWRKSSVSAPAKRG